MEIPKKEITVSPEEIMADIDREREQNARDVDVDDRPVQDGDRIKLFGGPTSGGEEELVFDMAPEELEGLDIIMINLFAADDDRCFIEIRP